MIKITQKLNIPEDRTLVIKVPEMVTPGPHGVVLILNEQTSETAASNAEALMRFAGTIRSFAGIDGREYQRHMRAEWE